MKIGTDGYFLSQNNGAFGRIAVNVINLLTDMDREDQFYVFTDTEGASNIVKKENLNFVYSKEAGEGNFLKRRRAIERAINEKRLLLDVFIELYDIGPRLDARTKTITLIHDFLNGKLEPRLSIARVKGLIYRHYQLKSIRNSKLIFCNSEFTKSQLPSNVDLSKVIVSHLGCDEIFEKGEMNDFVRDAEEQSPAQNFFLFVGRVTVRHKNISLLLDSSYRYISSEGEASLVIASTEDPTEEDKARISRLGSRVTFYKSLRSEQIAYFYSNAKAFIFPSFYEGFGHPILEAQHVGCPLILNNIPVFHEVSGDCALFFNGTVEDLFLKMKEIESEEVRISLRRCGFDNSKNYSRSKFVESVYKELKKMEAKDGK
ncbi:MAG: glycosyltransferase family 1 protein [Thermoplasmatales archaeon]